jgi:hypothetical protein
LLKLQRASRKISLAQKRGCLQLKCGLKREELWSMTWTPWLVSQICLFLASWSENDHQLHVVVVLYDQWVPKWQALYSYQVHFLYNTCNIPKINDSW